MTAPDPYSPASIARAVERHDERECTCEPYLQDVGGGYFELLAEWDAECPVHGEGVTK